MAEAETWVDRVRRGEPLYQPDWGYIQDTWAAQELLAEFNAVPPRQVEKHAEMMARIFGHIGKNSLVLPRLMLDVGVNVWLGDDVFVNQNCTFLDTFPITIKRGTWVGPSTMFAAVGHPIRAQDRMVKDPATGEAKGLTIGAPIVVEEDVWIGGSVVVLPGVTIGARSSIGAGSVVTKSIPPDTLAYGNPCRPVRSLA
jgi:acetyltransferase-like isoleucine patch superfamily enzyme